MIAKDAFTGENPSRSEWSDHIDYNTSVPEDNQGQGFENLGSLKTSEIEFLLRRAPRRR